MKKAVEPKNKPIVPSDVTMQQLAKLPEDVKKMALAFAQGVNSGRKMARNRA